MEMPIISVNVSRRRTLEWQGMVVTTGIFKEPVAGRVAAGRLGLAGDVQADLTVHGGPDKAVYAYSAEHYELWRAELARELPWGMFGENLTVRGGRESDVRVGDLYRAGSALLRVTKPRTPCYKLGLRFGDDGMVRRFLASGRSGFYLAVAEEGELGAGDVLQLVQRDDQAPAIADVNRYYQEKLLGKEPAQR